MIAHRVESSATELAQSWIMMPAPEQYCGETGILNLITGSSLPIQALGKKALPAQQVQAKIQRYPSPSRELEVLQPKYIAIIYSD